MTNRRYGARRRTEGHRLGGRSRREAAPADVDPDPAGRGPGREGRGPPGCAVGRRGQLVQDRRLPSVRRGLQGRAAGRRDRRRCRPAHRRPRRAGARPRPLRPAAAASTACAPAEVRPGQARAGRPDARVRRARRALPGAPRHRGDLEAAATSPRGPAAARGRQRLTRPDAAGSPPTGGGQGGTRDRRRRPPVAGAQRDFAQVAKTVVLDDDDDDDVRATVISAITHGPTKRRPRRGAQGAPDRCRPLAAPASCNRAARDFTTARSAGRTRP